MPKVSVIIPVYNVEKYLKQCLDSVVNQTLQDIEIICVNDGSTDNSLKILEEYAQKDNRIIIISQENQGQSVARNIALEKATGEYVGFVDSDDYIDSNFYEELYRHAKKNNTDIACGEIYKPNENCFYIKYNKVEIAKKTKDKYKLAQIPKWNYIWNKIYKREQLIKTKFTPNIFYEDVIYTPQVVHKLHKLITVPNVVYYYQYNPASTVWQKTQKHEEDYKNAILETQKFIRENGITVDCCDFSPLSITYIKMFGLKLIKIYKYIFCTRILLFSKIPIIEYWYKDCKNEFELKI